MSNLKIGEVRPSQLLWTYGPGAVIDLPNISVITMGLHLWNTDTCIPVDEARLLAIVQKILGSQVKRLFIPPHKRDEMSNPFSAEGRIGVPVQPFPRWLRCVKCGLLADFESGLFELKPNPFRPERTHFIHKNCEKGGKSDAVPARFLLACRNGHLDDFPWHWFVHSGHSDCKGTLRFYENRASLQTEDLWVRCDTCGSAKSLAFAFGKEAKENLPACRGRHPHLKTFNECDEEPKTILLGATNGWFPVTVSVLAIPLEINVLEQLIADGWTYFEEATSVEEVIFIIRTLQKTNSLPGIEEHDPRAIWQAIEERKKGNSNQKAVLDDDIKKPEWDVLTSDKPPVKWPHFMSSIGVVPEIFRQYISKIVLLERLREVNVLLGYTRVETLDYADDSEEGPEMAALSNHKPEWLPAIEVNGEGIFIRFNEAITSEWEKNKAVRERDRLLRKGHEAWRVARKLDPHKGYPGIRYVLLHTLAHILIRELALECGYNAASIRERIYADNDAQSPMAGILIYTAAADSDGTLGGLVELGKPENLERIISLALRRTTICSSDPLCSEHDPGKDRSLHAAACHACVFVAETSCEKGNRFLDRTLLVPTFGNSDIAFFDTKDL